jgi:hypothetical protein
MTNEAEQALVGEPHRRTARGEVVVPCLQTAPHDPQNRPSPSADIEVVVHRSFVPSVVVVNEVEGVIDRGDGRPDLLAARSGYRLHLQRHLAIPVTDTCVAQVVGKS